VMVPGLDMEKATGKAARHHVYVILNNGRATFTDRVTLRASTLYRSRESACSKYTLPWFPDSVPRRLCEWWLAHLNPPTIEA